jgi:hypothetical protein
VRPFIYSTNREFVNSTFVVLSLRDIRNQTQRVSADRDEYVARASRSLEFVRPFILRRADVTRGQKRVEDVLEGLEELKRKNDKSTRHLLSSQTCADDEQLVNVSNHCNGRSAAGGLPSLPLDPLLTRKIRRLQVL